MTAPLEFRCPSCGNATQVTAEYCGQTGPCAQCGSIVTIPRAPSEPAAKGETSHFGRGVMLVVFTSLALLIGAVLTMTGVKLIEPIARGVVVAASQRESKSNLSQIAAALLAYQQKYGRFPPAAVCDSRGKPLHSWRVLILPFLGPAEKSLYEQYDFKEPWNGLNNQPLHTRMPAVFGSSRDEGRGPGETNYFVVVGKRTLLSDGRSAQEQALGGDPANLVLVVEAANLTGSSWLEPHDFPAGSLDATINSGAARQLNGVHGGGIYIAMGNGEVRFLADDISPDEIRALGLKED